MSTAKRFEILSGSLDDTAKLARKLAPNLRGGELIELSSDLGGGKTALTRFLVAVLGSYDEVSSPTFTIQNIYRLHDGREVHHFDFYRLDDPGIMAAELEESLQAADVITIIEWAGIVEDVLPSERLQIKILTTGEDSRQFEILLSPKYGYLEGALA